MKSLKSLLLTVGMLSLSACSGLDSYSEVETLNSIQPQGSAFSRELAEQYRIYSNAQLHDHFDYPDALHFARKGLAAAAGESVLPEPITDWNLDEYHADLLAEARSRLIIAFDYGARETLPSLSARAQGQFDCWIEVQEEYWTDQSAELCQSNFMTLMDQIEAQIVPADTNMVENVAPIDPVDVPEVEPVQELAFDSEVFDIDPNQPMAPENAMYLIFFNWDSAKIGSNAMNILDSVMTEVSNTKPQTVKVVGHTDTSGAKAYNQRLALKRAKATRDALVAKGMLADKIVMDAKGETDLLVPTPDNVREPANRRVNISFE